MAGLRTDSGASDISAITGSVTIDGNTVPTIADPPGAPEDGYVLTWDNDTTSFVLSAPGGLSYPLLAPDGTVTDPSYSFTSAPTAGLWLDLGWVTLKGEDNQAVVLVTTDTGLDPDQTSNVYVAGPGVTLSTSDGSVSASIGTGITAGVPVLSFTGNVGTPLESAAEVGFRGIPQIIEDDATRTFALDDIGRHLFQTSGAASPATWTIPLNATVAFPIGSVITIVVAHDSTQGVTVDLADPAIELVSIVDYALAETIFVDFPGQMTLLKVDTNRWHAVGINVFAALL